MGTTKSSLSSAGRSSTNKIDHAASRGTDNINTRTSSGKTGGDKSRDNHNVDDSVPTGGKTSKDNRGSSVLVPTKPKHGRSSRIVSAAGAGRIKLSLLFQKTPPRNRRGRNSLPGGASVTNTSSSSTSVSPTRRTRSNTVPTVSYGWNTEGAPPPKTLRRGDGSNRNNSMALLSPGTTRPFSGSESQAGRPGTGGDGRSVGRMSIRFIRQPSTYGELHDMVARQKLGDGMIRGLVGLQNLGNTCFMNSALQCLMNCEALIDYFLGFDWKGEINESNFLGHKGLMASAFGTLANDMWRSQKESIRPRDFKKQVGESMPLFAGYEQQDVQEFLAFLLDAVHEDLNRVPNADRKYVEAKEAKEGEPEEKVAMEAWRGYLERNRSIIVDLFQGQLRSALQCGVCGRRSVTFDPFMYLSVPLPEDDDREGKAAAAFGGGGGGAGGGGGGGGRRGKMVGGGLGGGGPEVVPLESCIRRFCEVETLDGDNAWYCSNCKKHQPATKKLDLWKVPPVLIVHLKRFAGSAKISSPVKFPLERLDLSEVVKSPQREAPDYDLFATANHHGSVHGGHYTAVAKNRLSGSWNLFNDERVEGLENHEVQSASAYVLFYTKMSTLEESFEEASKVRSQRQPPAEPAAMAMGGGARVRVDSAGGRGSTDGNPARNVRENRPARGKAKSGSPKRAVAVVRRQSMSKPHNWPHLHLDDSTTTAFQPAMGGDGSTGVPLPTSARATAAECSPRHLQNSRSTMDATGDSGEPTRGDRRLTRSLAEQGYGRPLPSDRGTTLPKIRGASPTPSAAGADSGVRDDYSGFSGSPRGHPPDLRGGEAGRGGSAGVSS